MYRIRAVDLATQVRSASSAPKKSPLALHDTKHSRPLCKLNVAPVTASTERCCLTSVPLVSTASRNLASCGWHRPTRQICETTRFVPGALANGAATTCSRGMSVCRTARYSGIFSLSSLFFQIAKGPVHDPSLFVLSVTNFPPSDVGLASHRPGMCVCVCPGRLATNGVRGIEK